MDTVYIEKLLLEMSIGTLADEFEKRQPVIIDAQMQFDCARAGESDNLEHALDYSAAATLIEQIAAEKHYQLVEHFAETLATHLLETFPMQSVTIRVGKPQALVNTKLVGVQITRHRTS